MAKAGRLHDRVALDAPVTVSNNAGGQELGWAEQFIERAEFVFLRGTETVMAQRLAGVQPAVIIVRSSTRTRRITTDWRLRDVRTSVEYNIRTVIESDNRRFIEMTAESGVAV